MFSLPFVNQPLSQLDGSEYRVDVIKDNGLHVVPCYVVGDRVQFTTDTSSTEEGTITKETSSGFMIDSKEVSKRSSRRRIRLLSRRLRRRQFFSKPIVVDFAQLYLQDKVYGRTPQKIKIYSISTTTVSKKGAREHAQTQKEICWRFGLWHQNNNRYVYKL